MKKYLIEREMAAGTLGRERLRETGAKFAHALRELEPEILWLESFVAEDKTFSVYLANDEAVVRRHAELVGFPASKITEIGLSIDNATCHVH
jgi:hypothetical protein